MSADLAFIDGYLEQWDVFAQGKNELAPYLRENKPKFETALAELSKTDSKAAASRIVFYSVVQVGGAIPSGSPLGLAACEILGADFPVTTTKEGKKVFFAADLYHWWTINQADYSHLQRFDDWQNRDFARKTVLPMYQKVQQSK